MQQYQLFWISCQGLYKAYINQKNTPKLLCLPVDNIHSQEGRWDLLLRLDILMSAIIGKNIIPKVTLFHIKIFYCNILHILNI
jgi:hypothetical protein